jgi:hypothetical protein
MPNDAKLGFFLGIVVVIALSIIYRGKGTETPPEASVPAGNTLAAPNPWDATARQAIKWPSLPVGEKVQIDKVGGKEDASERQGGETESAHKKHEEEDGA